MRALCLPASIGILTCLTTHAGAEGWAQDVPVPRSAMVLTQGVDDNNDAGNNNNDGGGGNTENYAQQITERYKKLQICVEKKNICNQTCADNKVAANYGRRPYDYQNCVAQCNVDSQQCAD